MRAIHPLHRHAKGVGPRLECGLNLLEMFNQRRAAIPIHAIRAGYDVISAAGRHRDKHDVVEFEILHEGAELGFERCKFGPRPADEVHLVDGNDELAHAERRYDQRVPLCLTREPGLGANQH